jgi:hypothetical protein|nr:hypothetical protein [Kofleriaceae bacterium]
MIARVVAIATITLASACAHHAAPEHEQPLSNQTPAAAGSAVAGSGSGSAEPTCGGAGTCMAVDCAGSNDTDACRTECQRTHPACP